VKIGILARIGAPLALLAVCAFARPASAQVLADLSVATSEAGPFLNQLTVVPDTKLFFRVAVLNRFSVPAVARVEVPLIRFSTNAILPSGQVASRLITAIGRTVGTHNVTLHVLYLNPFTGRVFEVTDTVRVIVGTLGPTDGKKDSGSAGQQQGGAGQQQGGKKDDTGGLGDKKDDTGGAGQQGQQGQQGGTGSQGGKKDDTGTLGGKKDDTGGLGDKKDDTGGAGQQQGSAGQQGGTGSQGGQQGGTGSQGGQQGGTGGKKDDAGGLGKGDTFLF
jgi:hypothetical protein